ncbi:MAG: substrate-binding domain-containing protein [Firmicutes bacterium]|nr:substrate-binding domain-containing protein [Bacillota bacterium]
MKKMRKVFMLLIVSVLIISISGGVLAEDFKIGINNYLQGLYCLDVLERFAVYTADNLGMKSIAVNDEAKLEKTISNVENLIASGVDGIVFFGISDTLFPVVSNKCRAAQVPFVLYDHLPTGKTLKYLRQNPYFVGAVGERDYNAGFPIGEFAVESNLKKAIIVTGKRGDTTHEARVKGFTDAFETNGGKVLGVGWGCVTRFDAMGITENLVVANQDIDTVYVSGGDWGIGALQILKKHANIDARLYITDLDPPVLEALNNKEVAAANGAHWINSGFAVALLHNYLLDKPLLNKDGQAPVIEVPILVLPNTQANAYQEWWLDNQPFTAEEMKNMSYKWNKDVSLDDFREVMKNYSIESRLIKRYEEGKISKEELESYGI